MSPHEATTQEPRVQPPTRAAARSSEGPTNPIGALARIIGQAERFPGDAYALGTGERAALARLDPDGELQPHQVAALTRALLFADLTPERWRPETNSARVRAAT